MIRSSMFAGVVAGVTGQFHRQILVTDFHAAGQARLGIEAPGVVHLVVFFVVGLGQTGVALADVDMAGGARGDHFAGVLNLNASSQHAFAQRCAALEFKGHTFGAQVGMGQDVDLGHKFFQ